MTLQRKPPTTGRARSLRMETSFDVERGALRRLEAQDIQAQLQGFARSTRVRLDTYDARLSLDGADLSYHAADPGLAASLTTFVPAITANQLGSFHTRLEHFDFCLEDSWTGKLIAETVGASKFKDRLTIMHLDDHTDMMPTLLSVESALTEQVNQPKRFDSTNPSDWDEAIRSGAIGIGSFMTALYYLPLELDVRHLCHTPDANQDTLSVIAATRRHTLLPHVEFAAVDKITGLHASRLGTYTASVRAADLLREGQNGPMIVHVVLVPIQN